jgi:hypothetical protein
MTAYSNVRDRYFAVDELVQATQQAGRAFERVLADKPAEPPIARHVTPQENANPEQQATYPPSQMSPQGQVSPPFVPPSMQPYLPPPPTPRYKVDEAFLRKMARLKASTNLKYLATISRFARNIVGNMAASNAMVELVEKYEKGFKMTEEELEMVGTVQKAVTQRRKIESTDAKILTDEEMREIYEELLFQEMYDHNERGVLELQNPKDFIWSYTLLTLAEIAENGREVIGDRVSGAFKSVSKKFKK